MRDLSYERLKKALIYDPGTGEFTRLTGRGKRRAGDIAGGISPSDGYVRMRVYGVHYLGIA